EDLRAAGWRPDDVECWRDCGWSVLCARDGSRVEVSLAGTTEGEWTLQIAPALIPGPIARLFGVKRSATSRDVYELSVAVHAALLAAQVLQSPRWAWDSFPDDSLSTPEPR